MTEQGGCPNCGSMELYQAQRVEASSVYGPKLLPGLVQDGMGKTTRPIGFRAIVCRECGLIRYFVLPNLLEKLDNTEEWTRVEG